MSVKNSYSYPHPVLGVSDDFKNGEFKLDPNLSVKDDFLVLDQGEIIITNDYLKELFESKKITILLKLICPSTLYSKIIIGTQQEKIKISNLANEIQIESFLIVNEDLLQYENDSFNDDYKIFGTGKFTLKRNDVVGVGGQLKVNLNETYTKGLKSLFKFNARIGIDSFLEFDYDAHNITISYPYDKDVDGANYLNILKSKPKTFLFLFVIPALSDVYQKMIIEHTNGSDIDDHIANYKPADILNEFSPNWRYDSPQVSAQRFLSQVLGQVPGESTVKKIHSEFNN